MSTLARTLWLLAAAGDTTTTSAPGPAPSSPPPATGAPDPFAGGPPPDHVMAEHGLEPDEPPAHLPLPTGPAQPPPGGWSQFQHAASSAPGPVARPPRETPQQLQARATSEARRIAREQAAAAAAERAPSSARPATASSVSRAPTPIVAEPDLPPFDPNDALVELLELTREAAMACGLALPHAGRTFIDIARRAELQLKRAGVPVTPPPPRIAALMQGATHANQNRHPGAGPAPGPIRLPTVHRRR